MKNFSPTMIRLSLKIFAKMILLGASLFAMTSCAHNSPQKTIQKAANYRDNVDAFRNLCVRKEEKENIYFAGNTRIENLTEYVESNGDKQSISDAGTRWGMVIPGVLLAFGGGIYVAAEVASNRFSGFGVAPALGGAAFIFGGLPSGKQRLMNLHNDYLRNTLNVGEIECTANSQSGGSK